MKQDEFRKAIKTRTDIDNNDRADEVIEAVLSTLSQRITADEAEDLAAQLPEPYKTYFGSEGGIQTFGIDEYFERVAGKLRVGTGESTRYAQAVLNVLDEAVTAGEMGHVKGQLPQEYSVLFE